MWRCIRCPGVGTGRHVEIDHATEEIARYILHINPYYFYFKDGGALVCAVTEHDDECAGPERSRFCLWPNRVIR
jgi:hypothetical protein